MPNCLLVRSCVEVTGHFDVEALACGLPVISTPVAGIPEAVIDQHNGLIVPQRDELALANAMQKLIEESDLRIRLTKNARESVSERFNVESTALQLNSLLRQAPATFSETN